MDCVFGFETDGFKEEELQKLVGKKEFQNYVKEIQKEKLSDSVILELSGRAVTRICEIGNFCFTNFSGVSKKCNLRGKPFLLALLLEDFDTAQKLLDKMNKVSINNLYMVGTDIASFGNFGYWNKELDENVITIEKLLYNEKLVIPPALRENLLSRLSKEADDLYDFSLKRVRNLKHTKIQEALSSDVKKYPQLFARNSSLFAYDMHALLFLLKIFEDPKKKEYLLKNNSACIYTIPEQSLLQIKQDKKEINKLVNAVKAYSDLRMALNVFLMRTISQVRTAASDWSASQDLIDACRELEEEIWRLTEKLNFKRVDFNELLLIPDKVFRIEVLYELAYRKLREKMPLEITVYPGMDLMSFFNINDERALQGLNGYFALDPGKNQVKLRLIKLLSFVGKISYEEGEQIEGYVELHKELGNILVRNADDLKDIFIELLELGLIPDEQLDPVMKRVMNSKKCTYMFPLLVLQKYGGLLHDKN